MGKGVCECVKVGEGKGLCSWSSFKEIRQVRVFFTLPQSSSFCSPVTPDTQALSSRSQHGAVTLPPIPCVSATSTGLCPKYWKVTNHWFK